MEITSKAYLFLFIESKQRFISQIMTEKDPYRSMEEVDESVLDYAQIKALATGDNRIKERLELDIEVTKLRLLKSNYKKEQYRLQELIEVIYPNRIKAILQDIEGKKADYELYQQNLNETQDFKMVIQDKVYTVAEDAIAKIKEIVSGLIAGGTHVVGNYLGFNIVATYDEFYKKYGYTLENNQSYQVLGILGMKRIHNTLDSIQPKINECKERLEKAEKELEGAKTAILEKFERDEELIQKSERLAQLNVELKL